MAYRSLSKSIPALLTSIISGDSTPSSVAHSLFTLLVSLPAQDGLSDFTDCFWTWLVSVAQYNPPAHHSDLIDCTRELHRLMRAAYTNGEDVEDQTGMLNSLFDNPPHEDIVDGKPTKSHARAVILRHRFLALLCVELKLTWLTQTLVGIVEWGMMAADTSRRTGKDWEYVFYVGRILSLAEVVEIAGEEVYKVMEDVRYWPGERDWHCPVVVWEDVENRKGRCRERWEEWMGMLEVVEVDEAREEEVRSAARRAKAVIGIIRERGVGDGW